VPSPSPAEVETVTVIAPPVAESADEVTPSDEDEPDGDVPAQEEPSEPESTTDEIGSLFASLRDDTVEQPQSTSETADTAQLGEPESPPEADPPIEVSEDATSTDVEPEALVEGESDEPEDLDVALIPLQNAALKEIKRTLVDLQNDALEHLRTDTDWVPKKSFTNQFKKPFVDLAVGITDSKGDGGAAKEFSADLNTAVVGAIVKARESGAGDRQVASSVSRVFRMWRADESERRVVDAALALSELRPPTA
jgi:hypothetical protein